MSSRTENGFTLVEVMVAMTIMAIIIAAAFSALSIGLDSWERAWRRMDKMDRQVTVERLLKQQIGVAYPGEIEIDGQKSILFRGSAQKVEFVSEYSLVDGSVDFRKIDYLFKGGKFLYGETPLYGSLAPVDNGEPPARELATFNQVSFSFLRANADGEPAWLNDWKQDMRLPRAVRVRIDDDLLTIPLVNQP